MSPNSLSLQEFAQYVKRKYPQYQNAPDAELASAYIQKFPEYNAWIKKEVAPTPEKKSIGGFIGNIFKSAGGLASGIGSAVVNTLNPNLEKNTLVNLGKMAVGAGELLIPGEQGQEKYARNIGSFYKQRYGGLSNIGNTVYSDPVGVVADLATLLSGGAAAAGKVGQIGKISGLIRAAEGIGNAAKIVDPLRAMASPITKVAETAGNILDKIPSRLVGSYMKQTASQIAKEGNVSELLLKQGTKYVGKTPDKIYKIAAQDVNELENAISTKLEKSQRMVDIDNVYKKVAKEFSGSNLTAEDVKNLITKKVQSQAKVAGGGTWDSANANRLKVAVGEELHGKFGLQHTSFETDVMKKFRGELADKIKNINPSTIPLFGKQTIAIRIRDVASRVMNSGKGNQLIGLGDIGAGGVGSILGGGVGGFATIAAKRILESPQFKSIAAYLVKNRPDVWTKILKLAPDQQTRALMYLTRIINPNQTNQGGI